MIEIFLIPTVLSPDTQHEAVSDYTKEIINSLKFFYVENIKTTRRLISSLKLDIDINELDFFEINQKTDYNELFMSLNDLQQNAGVISEAGCPGVADPGALVVDIAHELGYKVKPLVGPSSILLALMASGMSGQSFVFHGYLPIQENERQKKLRELEKDALSKKQTQIFIETPYRNNQVLATALSSLQSSTKLCIAVNLTAENELIKTKTINKWRKDGIPDIHKMPCVFLIF